MDHSCWLIAMLLLVMNGALAVCGLVLDTLNAVSLGPETHWLAAGAVFPATDSAPDLAAQLDPHQPGVWLTGWTLLGECLGAHVERRVFFVVLAIVSVVTICRWLWFRPSSQAASSTEGRLTRPSSAYGPRLWRLGLLLVRWLPRPFCCAVGNLGTSAYRWLRPARVRAIEENLLPVFDGDRVAARLAARRLLTKFSTKITDLLRHESGASRDLPISRRTGYEIFQSALDRRQGVLLVTPHLGNWEFGGCLLAQKGVRLLVLTQAEPGQGFTELRQQARARWGVETLVIGQDAFAFVEVIKRLQAGAAVALLVDRPPPPTAVTVELFGRSFQASLAPAELARASGAALVPVYAVAEGDGYAAHVLPEIAYDRRAISDREARRRLAGEILRAFEPVIRQHADQWYHFAPLWNGGAPLK